MNKNKLTNVCGLLMAIAGSLSGLALTSAVVLPSWLTTVCLIITAVCGGIIGYATGKPPVV